MTTPQQRSNGGNGKNSQPTGPRDELDVASTFVSPTTYEDVLQEVNLGTGNYDPEDIAMQMRSFRSGLVADVAFDGVLLERAIYETQIKLADEGFAYYDETDDKVRTWGGIDECDDLEAESRTQKLRERGQEIWKKLGRTDNTMSEKQATALSKKVGIDTFKPVHWRMLAAYHEATKSRGARTQDNFFGRIKKRLTDSEEDDGGWRPFGGGSE